MKMSETDKNEVKVRYSERLRTFGYSPRTLGWEKGKQDLRFDILTSHYDFTGKSILDIGCGFGDLVKTLRMKTRSNFTYCGIDLVEGLIGKARELYAEDNVTFMTGDFLGTVFPQTFDFAIASGIFNFKLKNDDNYNFIESVIEKSLNLCRDGIAFDFLSDKVDYRYEHTFHSSPEKILACAYKHSRNVILRNDYMPFEFSLFIFKDDSFSKEDTVFTRYKQTKPNKKENIDHEPQ